MKILFIGTGGVGGYFGGKLAQKYDVTFVARGSHLEALKKNGLTVKSINGNFHLPNVKTIASLENQPVFDVVFLCIKNFQLDDIKLQLPNIISSESIIIPLLNGISIENELAKIIPKKNIVHGFCKLFSKIEKPGVINHFGYEPTIIFGNLFHGNEKYLDILETLFSTSEITYKRSADILSDKWQKFIFICSGGLTAFHDATYGEVRENPKQREQLIELLTEITLLEKKLSVNLPSDFVNRNMKMIDAFPYEATSSMQRDIKEKRKSELEFLTGTVIKLAAETKIDVPINEMVYRKLVALEK